MKSVSRKSTPKKAQTMPVFLRLDSRLHSDAEALAKKNGLKFNALVSMALTRIVKSGI
jgi:predicted HicB family RNase H-like nuclease